MWLYYLILVGSNYKIIINYEFDLAIDKFMIYDYCNCLILPEYDIKIYLIKVLI